MEGEDLQQELAELEEAGDVVDVVTHRRRLGHDRRHLGELATTPDDPSCNPWPRSYIRSLRFRTQLGPLAGAAVWCTTKPDGSDMR